MNMGYIKLYRESLDSYIFGHEGLWKLFCLCLMKASHKETEVTISGILIPIKLRPGQFITGRDSLHFDYHQGDLNKKYSSKATPTAITLYRWLLNLKKMQILNINSYNKYSIITICNWNHYQKDEQQMNNRRTTDEHKQECIKNDKETPIVFFNFLKRYPNQDLIQKAFDAICSTRKSGKVSNSILIAQLQEWDQYPVNQVEEGIKIYLDKDYASQGKKEKYLLGIIRNQKTKPQTQATTRLPKIYTSKELEAMNNEY